MSNKIKIAIPDKTISSKLFKEVWID